MHRVVRDHRLLGVALALAVGCRDTTSLPAIAQVTLLAPDTAGVVGRTLRVYAVPYDAQGVSVPHTPIVWASLDPNRAQVDSDGHVLLGPQAGDVLIVAAEPRSGHADTTSLHAAAEGEVRWRFRVTGVANNMAGPVLGGDGTIYALGIPFPGVQNLGDLYAFNAHGRLEWTVRLDRTSANGFLAGPDGSIFVTGSTVRRIGPDGSVLWTRALQALSPAFIMGALGTSGPLIVAAQDNPIALDPYDGDTVWLGPASPLGRWLVPPTLAGDTVWLKKTEDTLYAFVASTGSKLATAIPDPDSGLDKSTFGVGPVPLASRLFLPTWSRLAAFNGQGQLQWLTPPQGRGVSEPVIDAAGGVYFQTSNYLGLIALDGVSGAQRWQAGPGRSRWSWYGGPALAQGGIIYSAGLDGFYAYDTSGVLRWRFQTIEDSTDFVPFTGAPAVGPDGTVYTWTDHYVYAFWGSHPPEPNSPWPMWRHDARRSGVAR